MLPTIVIGLLFALVIGFAAWKSIRSIRENKCPGCSGACAHAGSCATRQASLKK